METTLIPATSFKEIKISSTKEEDLKLMHNLINRCQFKSYTYQSFPIKQHDFTSIGHFLILNIHIILKMVSRGESLFYIFDAGVTEKEFQRMFNNPFCFGGLLFVARNHHVTVLFLIVQVRFTYKPCV